MSGNKTRILIVDDHPIVRRGLRELVADETDLEVCGEACDVEGALTTVAELNPDIIVVDLVLKEGHGLALIEAVHHRSPNIKMLVSSMHDEMLYAERALRCGASGYISKQESPEQIIDAIRDVMRGEIFVSKQVSAQLLHRLSDGQAIDEDPVSKLTNRELQVFEFIGQGLSTKQIARHLQISKKTVEAHREGIKLKLNLTNSVEVSRRATVWVLEGR